MAFKDLKTQNHEPIESSKYIFVDTEFNFKTSTAPIFVLALMEKNRYIQYFGDNADVAQTICTHYAKNNGELPFWGEIKRYHFIDHLDSRTVIYDTKGNALEESLKIPEKATLALGGKNVSW